MTFAGLCLTFMERRNTLTLATAEVMTDCTEKP